MKLVKAKEGYRKVGDKWLLAKKCTECGRWLVASKANFNRKKTGKYGLEAQCKECRNKYHKQYRKNNKEKIGEYGKQYREANKDKIAQYREANREKMAEYGKQYYKNNKNKIAESNKQYREDNKEKIAKQKKQYYETNKDKIAEYYKQYYETNKNKIDEYHKQYCEINKDKIAEYHKQYGKQYRENNREKIAEYYKRYRQSPQGQVVEFNRHHRRRTKEEQQGTGITKDQWLELMSFFDWKCAYSGEYLGGSNNSFNRTIDHIVPLNSNGDNMIWNCAPMTRSLNSSKNDKDMLEWYREQDCYSEARLAKIYEWQEYARKKWKK